MINSDKYFFSKNFNPELGWIMLYHMLQIKLNISPGRMVIHSLHLGTLMVKRGNNGFIKYLTLE